MNRTVATLTLAAGLLAGMGGPAVAQSSERLANGNSIYGTPHTGPGADRVIDLGTARAVNIVCGQTVLFRQGARTFAWKFDVVGHRSVELARIAPAGFSDTPLTIHIARNEGERA